MESNGYKLIANRMKKRGMSSTIRGAHRMAKVIQLRRNAEQSGFCRRYRPRHRHEAELSAHAQGEAICKTRLSRPHSSRPWTHSLRNLVKPLHRLN